MLQLYWCYGGGKHFIWSLGTSRCWFLWFSIQCPFAILLLLCQHRGITHALHNNFAAVNSLIELYGHGLCFLIGLIMLEDFISQKNGFWSLSVLVQHSCYNGALATLGTSTVFILAPGSHSPYGTMALLSSVRGDAAVVPRFPMRHWYSTTLCINLVYQVSSMYWTQIFHTENTVYEAFFVRSLWAFQICISVPVLSCEWPCTVQLKKVETGIASNDRHQGTSDCAGCHVSAFCTPCQGLKSYLFLPLHKCWWPSTERVKAQTTFCLGNG